MKGGPNLPVDWKRMSQLDRLLFVAWLRWMSRRPGVLAFLDRPFFYLAFPCGI